MPTTDEHVPDNPPPPYPDGPTYTPDEIAAFEAEVAHEREMLAAFIARFDADPEGVARVFAAVVRSIEHDGTWATTGDIVDEMGEARFPAQHEESIECTLTLASAAGLVTIRYCNDGDEDSPPTTTWPTFYVDDRARTEMLIVGVQRWLEHRCVAVRPRPAPVGVTQQEVVAFLASARNHYATVDGIIAHFVGDGEAPRPVDRALVAEVLLARAEQRALAAVAGLRGLATHAGVFTGMVDAALDGAQS